MKSTFRVALAGNPNCGKTTIFNILTGTRQHVGNYPGVTVERKCGSCRVGDVMIEIIDLPGIYSLSSSSPEEKVALRELISEHIDLILNIVDSSNAQRNLYLTTQLAELGIPMLLVFNMADDARKLGLKFEFQKLEQRFGVKIVETVGSKGEGIELLEETMAMMVTSEAKIYPAAIRYGAETDKAIAELTLAAEKLVLPFSKRIPARYFAVKLLENDEEICALPEFAPLLPDAAKWRSKLSVREGVNSSVFMADRRYGMISGAFRDAVRTTNERRRQVSDYIDMVVANRFLGVPIFLAMMYVVFKFTFSFADPLMGVIESAFTLLGDGITSVWPEGRFELVRLLLVDGIIGGVGGVLVFLPNILLLFLAIAFLEGTGYMARAAFIMDGFMRTFGMHGKSFIPMLLGFGCTVPAVMATRTIESEKDRLTTIMILPLMSCGARLPIYSLIIPAFFPKEFQALTMWIIYMIGVLLALVCAGILKSTLFKGEGEVFVLELPPYRMPTVRSLLIHMWERSVMYLKKAGTLILAASIILWMINTFPIKEKFSVDYDAKIAAVEKSELDEQQKEMEINRLGWERRSERLEYAAAGRIGKAIHAVMHPLGFDWKVSSALVGAFAAKELFVSQLGILYSAGDVEDDSSSLRERLRENYTPLQAFCIMLFCLISMPCMATVSVVRRETNSWLLTGFQLLGLTLLAYVITLIVYQTGLFLGVGSAVL